ncbi:pyocin knob domain-containing protein [Providencia rettgeri]
MYSTGTVTTTANSTKLVGTGTKWLNNINRVSAEQAIQIQIGTTVHNNSIQSIQSDTELTLNFPLPTAATGAKYVILTTMVHSVSDAMNKIVSMNVSNVQFSDILTRWMTEQGIITVTLPDQTTQQLRTTKEMDKQLDGKFDKSGGTISGDVTFSKNAIKSTEGTHVLPAESGTLMQVGDYGWGAGAKRSSNWNEITENGVYVAASSSQPELPRAMNFLIVLHIQSGYTASQIAFRSNSSLVSTWRRSKDINGWGSWYEFYTEANTTKDSNGNLKAASPIVKLFADDIELNDESEGVEMEHLGIGHYLIKGVVGFNADGAWGINNGFVIPQDHNGKNMVLIDYEVRPDGDIEVFVFHQQNADMPERFQNKRIKHFDEEGAPVYFENYEPCDVPESRWIDMRVEMPPNSTYNQKQAEAERLAKIEAERLAQEEAKRAAEEAERAEQEAAERKQYDLGDNDALL